MYLKGILESILFSFSDVSKKKTEMLVSDISRQRRLSGLNTIKIGSHTISERRDTLCSYTSPVVSRQSSNNFSIKEELYNFMEPSQHSTGQFNDIRNA